MPIPKFWRRAAILVLAFALLALRLATLVVPTSAVTTSAILNQNPVIKTLRSVASTYLGANGISGINGVAEHSPMSFEEAVQVDAHLGHTFSTEDRCYPVHTASPVPPDSVAIDGIETTAVPGEHRLTFSTRTDLESQEKRDRQIAKLDYLVTHGFLRALDGERQTAESHLATKQYALTWKGLGLGRGSFDGHSIVLCLPLDRYQYAGIREGEQIQGESEGLKMRYVPFRLTLAGTPSWAAEPRALTLFEGLAEYNQGEGMGTARVARVGSGWRSINEIERDRLREEDRPGWRRPKTMPSTSAARAIIGDRPVDSCLPIPVVRGGDDRRAFMDKERFVVTYYDKGERPQYDMRRLTAELHILAALEAIGLAKSEVANDGEHSGVRYEVDAQASSYLRFDQNDGHQACLPMGDVKIEVLRVQTENFMANGLMATARGTIESTSQIAENLAQHLTVVNAAIKDGVFMACTLQYDPEKDIWTLRRIQPVFGKMLYSGLPNSLVARMPKTVAALEQQSKKGASNIVR
jgi:hypothetical protein